MSAPAAIAGDVATVEQLAARLGGVAEETSYAAARLDRLHAGTWLGKAADTFADKSSQLPPKFHTASDAFRSAESAYRAYASDLSHGQSEALRAIALWSSGDSVTASWRAQVDALPADDPGKATPDPGAGLRDQASAAYRDAVDLVDASARRAADTLHQAAALAPRGPGLWAKAWHVATSFADGVWDGTVGMVKMSWEFSPIRLVIEPQAWAHDTAAMGKAMFWGVTHPVAFGKAVAHNFMEDPAHSVGELVPGLVVAAATGGTGLAATAIRTGAERAATIAASTAEKLAIRARSLDFASEAGSRSVNSMSFGLARLLKEANAPADAAVSSAAALRLRTALTAREIAQGHAFTKHVLDKGEFPEVRTRSQFAALIEDVLSTGESSQLLRGRQAYWKDGTFVVRDASHPDGGTAFRPGEGYAYFLRQHRDRGTRGTHTGG